MDGFNAKKGHIGLFTGQKIPIYPELSVLYLGATPRDPRARIQCFLLTLIMLLPIANLFGCASTMHKTSPEPTWKFSIVMLPAKYSVMGITQLAPSFYEYQTLDAWSAKMKEVHLIENDSKVPVVLHLHGCAGIHGADNRWASVYAEMGYLTILPNSFRRPIRQFSCNRGTMDYKARMRIQELTYAREQIAKIPWVDQERIFLSGFSEGAQGVSYYYRGGFAAHVLIGTDCRFVNHNPRAPDNTPVLNVVGSHDHYGYGRGCNISRDIGGSKKLIIKGAGHDLSHESRARDTIRAFLEDCCRK